MGTTAHVVVPGRPALERYALDRLRQLEEKWTRFSETSELSRLNAAAGRREVVSAETFAVIEKACEGWRLSAGRFDPTILHAVVNAGYDRSFDAMLGLGGPVTDDAAPSRGCADIELWPDQLAVRLPAGVGLDLGGVAKGWAADLIVVELFARGATGACVNVGGDLRVAGDAPTSEGWVVGVDDPRQPGREIARIRLSHGSVATTSRLRRAWRRGSESLHHVIDPVTGTSAVTAIAAVTVVAGEGWLADVLAKSLFLGLDADDGLLARFHASALVVFDQGGVARTEGFERFAA